MKKSLSMVLALALSLSMALPAFAVTEITSANVGANTGETVVTYGTSEGFTVTIPADFNIDTATNKATADVKADDVMIAYGKTLNVKISGDDYVDSWELIDTNAADNTLTYEIGTTEGGNDIVNNSVVLSVAAGNTSGATETLYFEVIDNLTKAGTYKDTLTFTVSVD